MHTRVSFCAWFLGRKGGLPCTCVPGPSTNPPGKPQWMRSLRRHQAASGKPKLQVCMGSVT